jgi:hypothetical protein
MGWISPTGHIDIDNKWNNEELAYDDTLDTNAVSDAWTGKTWGSFIEFTHASMPCSGVRFCAPTGASNQVDIDVYYSDSWHDVYQGTFAHELPTFIEKSLESSQTITSFRFRFYINVPGSWSKDFYEVEFYEEAVTVTTEAATEISYQCAMGNGTITSGTNATERGFEVKVAVDFYGVGPYVWWHLIGFIDIGDIVWDMGQWTGTLTKTETETGDFAEGAYELVLGYPDVFGEPDSIFDDALEECESYTYRAYAIIGGVTYYGEYVAFDTLCYPVGEYHPKDDISDGNPIEPIIQIEIPPEEITPIEIPPYGYPPFEWIPPEEIPYPPWDWTLPPWEMPDYPSLSFVGDFYYKKPYTKKDLDELREKCIIYNKNSVELALVLRHNMNVLKEFFNMMTDYLGKEEFNDFTDLIPPQNLKQLYLDPLGVNDFKDMINGFIRNSIDNNMAVNRNFKLIEEGLVDYETGSEDAYFKEINTSTKSINEDDPDVERLKRVIDNLNEDTSSNYDNITYNLEVIRARLL